MELNLQNVTAYVRSDDTGSNAILQSFSERLRESEAQEVLLHLYSAEFRATWTKAIVA
jgi:hypothetical protein